MTTTTSSLESKETASLIASDKVEGTAVYGADQKKIGSIQRVMIDKISGKVAYAVLSFGGFMGNWRRLLSGPMADVEVRHQSRRLSRTNLTKDQLDKAYDYYALLDSIANPSYFPAQN